jgi:hypothetical protein
LYGFLHADGVHNQLQMGQDFWLVAADVTFHGLVSQQFGEIALANDQTLGPRRSRV